ncbi:hypothetical protein BC830DRAFT_1171523 [Chytriomyces sp. MP71]|nr:hypothetical protein BC830DRAFT_1171523 [Chytriomyces sp. MP71]
MSTQISSVSIPSTVIRDSPSKHVVYQIVVRGTPPSEANSWQVWRRYKEFDALHTAFVALFPHAPPPVPLPPKFGFSLTAIASLCATGNATALDANKVEQRRRALEAYLCAIRSASDERWRTSQPWADFLGIPFDRGFSFRAASSSTATSTMPAYSLASTSTAAALPPPALWILEYTATAAQLRDIREAIATKDAHAARGDASATHAALAGIRAAVRAVGERVGVLDEALREHVIASVGVGGTAAGGVGGGVAGSPRGSAKKSFVALTPSEIQRREDLLVNLKEEKDRVVTLLASSAQSAQAASREALMGTGATNVSGGVGAYPENNELFARNTNGNNGGRGRRAFGAAAPKETEQTLGLENGGLLKLQQQTISEQDQVLESLSTVIGRQKEIGLLMGQELDLQNQMLGDLAEDVDRVGGNMKHVTKKLDVVSGKAKK